MDNKKRTFTILITGEVSSGKSSYVNSLIGGIVGNCSLQRETFNPILYTLTPKGEESNIINISNKLETIHKENEKKRNLIKELKEEDVSKPNILTDDNNSLPLRHGFTGNVTILDCPGINDSEDNNKKLFEKVFMNHISTIDLVIYVIEAPHAFDKMSEVKQFSEIKTKIDSEKLNGHYIDLIVIVNKFDDPDDSDLGDIFSRISKKIELPEDQIFKYSSHKMLIHTIKQNKLNMYVPKFMKKEIKTILKNADVKITKKISTELKDNEKSSILFHSDVEYNEDIEHKHGDWKHHVKYIKQSMEKIQDNILETLNKCFIKLNNYVIAFISNTSNKETELIAYFDSLRKLHKTCQHNNIAEGKFFLFIVKSTTQCLLEKKLTRQTLGKHTLIMLYQYSCMYLGDLVKNCIVDCVIQNKDQFDILTHQCIIYYPLKYNTNHDTLLSNRKYVEYVFSKSDVYSESKERSYHRGMWIYKERSYNMETKLWENPWKESLADYVINNRHSPSHMRLLLHLSKLKLSGFKSIHDTFQNNKKYIGQINFLGNDFMKRLTYWINFHTINQETNKFPMHHRLFYELSQDIYVVKFMKDFEQIQSYLT